jgi:hypothetical protein
VDPIDTGPSGDRLETFDVNERFVVVSDDEGYGVWGLDDLEDGYPVERFPDTDEGFEAAAGRWKELTRQDPRHRNQWLPWLKWIVLISAVAWALSGVLAGVLFFEVGSTFDQRGFYQELFRWTHVVNSAAYPLTLGGFAAYVVLWLESRRQGRGPFPAQGIRGNPIPWTSGRARSSIPRRSKIAAGCAACAAAEAWRSEAAQESSGSFSSS